MKIPRQVLVGGAIGLGAIVAIGGIVLIAQQGIIGSGAQRMYSQAANAFERGDVPKAQAQLEELVATFPDSPWADDGLLKLGEVYEAQQQLPEARAMYQTLLDRFPDSPLLAKTQERLGAVNVTMLFSRTVGDQDAMYEVRPGDTLGKIASAHGTTVELLKKANTLSSDVIRVGQKLKVPQGRFSIVVDKSQNQLLLTENDRFVKTYTVSTGKDNSTPVGTFKIITKVPNPVWYTEGAVVPADSPENILGTRWMGIDKTGYGIHGTTMPEQMGMQVTAGCVRMLNTDVEELFAIVPLGTDVTIVD
jgi:LysM repeat protein